MSLPGLFYPRLNSIRTAIPLSSIGLRILPYYPGQRFSNKPPQLVLDKTDETQQKKKKIPIPRITLIGQDENISITTLEEAEKISKRRELKLVKVVDFDMKTQRPVYKLMTGSEYLAEDLKQRERRKLDKANSSSLKGDKVLIISSGISEHDLKTQINKIIKWIGKQYEVRVVINGDKSNIAKTVSYRGI